jgi:hypothetical protein|tara:strand:+ start:6390 stop:6557 length:168 start_codon:yes stop_codon:yes gene_type:complete
VISESIGDNMKNKLNIVKLNILKVYQRKDKLKQILKDPKLQKKHKIQEFKPIECN